VLEDLGVNFDQLVSIRSMEFLGSPRRRREFLFF
jgi:hypothetical protein